MTIRTHLTSIDANLIEWAFTTGKRRHAMRLFAMAHRAAFFRKRLEWQYERERRLVVAPHEVSDVGGLLLADVSPAVLRFLILGARTPPEVRTRYEWFSTNFGVPLLEFAVGRKSYEPMFRRIGGGVLRWGGAAFEEIPTACSACSEPADDVDAAGRCVWCRIDGEVRLKAAKRSMLAATLYFGLDRELPFEFDGLDPKGRDAAAWIADVPRRRAQALREDMAMMLKLLVAMGRAGMLDDPFGDGEAD